MRIVVVGAGAIGGVIGGRLAEGGLDVSLVARGAHLASIQGSGLVIEDPDRRTTVRVPAVARVEEIRWQGTENVILATKTQDAETVLNELRDVAPSTITVVCATNGVETERLALRRFVRVIAMSVFMPAEHLEPGVVRPFCTPTHGVLDIGRYPFGTDADVDALASALSANRFASIGHPDIMAAKYRKLLMNLANVVEACCGLESEAAKTLMARARDEALCVYDRASISLSPSDYETQRRALLSPVRPINGRQRGGGSTWQSVARGATLEQDFLNGEIVLLGRLHGVATPVNEALQRLARRAHKEQFAPQSVDAADVLATVG